MKCSKCGTENPERAKFCNECGGELNGGEENRSIKKCPNCGFYIGDKTKCESCGYSIKTGNELKTNILKVKMKNNVDKIIMISSICLLIAVLITIITVSYSSNHSKQKITANQTVSTATAKPAPTAKPTPMPTVDPVAAQKAAEEKAAREKAAQEKAAADAAAAKEAEIKSYETGIAYNQLARTPNDYIGKKVKFYGKVIQVIEGTTETQLRLAIGGDYDSIIFCRVPKAKTTNMRILENDYITIYGTSLGLLTYESTLGSNITIPDVSVAEWGPN